MSEPTSKDPPSSRQRKAARIWHWIFNIGLGVVAPVLVIGAGAATARYLMNTPPEAERRERPRTARLVEVERIYPVTRELELEAMGTVEPARLTTLQPEVSGRIVEITPNYVPGGFVEQDELLFRIDTADYDMAIRQRQAAVEQAQSLLRMEEGEQLIARRELELLGETVAPEDETWVLRQPQLRGAEAAVQAAEVEVEQARLNLSRTRIHAPFNAVILNRGVELGMQASPSTMLVELAGTDEFWVRLSVPADTLRWIDLPKNNGERGSAVRIFDPTAWGPDAYRTGHVLRLGGALSADSRLAQLIVAVEDPYALADNASPQTPRLLLNSYVQARIVGRELHDVYVLRRENLHDGDVVWIMTEDNRLEIRPVQVAYRGRDEVYVSAGLNPGERLIVSRISTPIAGMDVRVSSSASVDPAVMEQIEQPDRRPLLDAVSIDNAATSTTRSPAAGEATD